MSTLAHSARFVRGLHSLGRGPALPQDLLPLLREQVQERPARFLAALDELVWPVATSPYRLLLSCAGIERGDVRRLVRELGFEGALEALRDAGVYVAHEEWLGTAPARRGSAVFTFGPQDFFNPRLRADFMGMTGASRSGGTPVAASFVDLRAARLNTLVSLAVWGARDAPAAVWLPVLPSAAGLAGVLLYAAAGNPPQAWFSQVDPGAVEAAGRKRAANRFLSLAGRLAGTPLPAPVTAFPEEPAVVLDWAVRALRQHGRALLLAYASSGVRLAQAAVDSGQRLDGLVIGLTGEPVTAGKTRVIARSGAASFSHYAFMQVGTGGVSCPLQEPEELHALSSAVGVVTRRRTRADGAQVDALLWTTLRPSVRSVMLNVENDDYAQVTHDDEPCGCLWGQAGVRQRLTRVRGLSKVVAKGVTIRAELFEQLVELALPDRFGGVPGDFQFAEQERDGATGLVLRIHPRLPGVEDDDARALVRTVLRDSEVGRLADDVWSGTALQVVREPPQHTASGKTLALETLR